MKVNNCQLGGRLNGLTLPSLKPNYGVIYFREMVGHTLLSMPAIIGEHARLKSLEVMGSIGLLPVGCIGNEYGLPVSKTCRSPEVSLEAIVVD